MRSGIHSVKIRLRKEKYNWWFTDIGIMCYDIAKQKTEVTL